MNTFFSDVQGLGKPLGFKGKGQEGKGQGKDFMTLRKLLPLWRVRGFQRLLFFKYQSTLVCVYLSNLSLNIV